MNVTAAGDYHPLISMGQHFDRVTGLLEQYERLSYGWDYYQLLTTSSEDLVLIEVIPEPGPCVLLLAGLAAVGRRRKQRLGG